MTFLKEALSLLRIYTAYKERLYLEGSYFSAQKTRTILKGKPRAVLGYLFAEWHTFCLAGTPLPISRIAELVYY